MAEGVTVTGLIFLALPRCGLILLLILTSATTLRAQSITDSTNPFLVRIDGTRGDDNAHGTGFVVLLRGDIATILTASHVLEGLMNVTITFDVARSRKYSIATMLGLQMNNPSGLAAFQVTNGLPKGVRALPLSRIRNPPRGTPLHLVGYAQMRDGPRELERRVVDRPNNEYQLEGSVYPGMSGGPAIYDGAAVGLITQTDETSSFAVPSGVLREFLGSVAPNREGGALRWRTQLSYLFLSLDPKLPRNLVHHENHPGDRSFLFGDPGSTDVANVTASFAQPSVGVTYPMGSSSVELVAEYGMGVPVSHDGRQERQQANDFRPATEGSFVFTTLRHVDVAHSAVVGLAVGKRSSLSPVGWRLEGLLHVGRLGMTFAKGWSRFRTDEDAAASRAAGLLLSPTVRLALDSGRWSLLGSIGLVRVAFVHSDSQYEPHTATGFQLAVGGRFDFGN